MRSQLALALATVLTTTGLAATATLTGAGTASASIGTAAKVTNACLESVPEPGSEEPVKICYSLFKPAGASRDDRVPMIMHSHGWGSSRTTDAAAFSPYLENGYGVLSFDQRGFGESGGQAHVENPRYEGHDVRKLIALIADQPWVEKDGPGDPRMGAIGGSYGGGFQFLAAFESLRTRGKPVLDALAPEITWYDLKESLAPEEVVRTEWASALTAAAVPTDALPHHVYVALADGAATGMWPDGSTPSGENLDKFFRRNGPKWHVQNGRKLDIPVLFGQGATDSLFPLRQGLRNFRKAITRDARRESIFVGYNGGHVLPAVFPRGVEVSSDPCSKKLGGGSFADLARQFFDEKLKGTKKRLRGYGDYHLATQGSTCTTVGSVAPDSTHKVGQVATTEAAGPPIAHQIAEGPIRIAGESYLTGTVTALGINNRAFYGLAVGSSPADAELVQKQVLPVNFPEPLTGAKRRITLPSVAVNVPGGQNLYLLATPFSDSFPGMGSRTPGAILIEDTVVHLPVVKR